MIWPVYFGTDSMRVSEKWLGTSLVENDSWNLRWSYGKKKLPNLLEKPSLFQHDLTMVNVVIVRLAGTVNPKVAATRGIQGMEVLVSQVSQKFVMKSMSLVARKCELCWCHCSYFQVGANAGRTKPGESIAGKWQAQAF